MTLYRSSRLPGGAYHLYETDATAEAFNLAAAGSGWLIGSSIDGIMTWARGSQDRKLTLSAAALQDASESNDDQKFLDLATTFATRYPQVPEGHALRAEALQRKGLFAAAISEVDQAAHLGWDGESAHAARAELYADDKNLGGAIQEWTALTQSAVPDHRSLALVARSNLLTEIGDLPQALRDANEAVATQPDEVTYMARAQVYRTMGDFERSLEDYNRSLKLLPDSAEVAPFRARLLQLRAEVHEALGRVMDAEADQAAAKAPQSRSAAQASSRPIPASATAVARSEVVRQRHNALFSRPLRILSYFVIIMGITLFATAGSADGGSHAAGNIFGGIIFLVGGVAIWVFARKR